MMLNKYLHKNTVDDGHECALICAAAKHCPITDTYVRVVPIITDVSVGGQFRNGTWTWLMERGHDSSFVRHSLVPARDDYLDAH